MCGEHAVTASPRQIQPSWFSFVCSTFNVASAVAHRALFSLANTHSAPKQPRQVIQSIPGIELVEMERNRENTWCCGGGGGLKGVNYDMSVEIGKDKVKEALATGAKRIISACPSCKTNINDAIRAVGADLKAIDITELVA